MKSLVAFSRASKASCSLVFMLRTSEALGKVAAMMIMGCSLMGRSIAAFRGCQGSNKTGHKGRNHRLHTQAHWVND